MRKGLSFLVLILVMNKSFSYIHSANLENVTHVNQGKKGFVRVMLPIIEDIKEQISKKRARIEELSKKRELTYAEIEFLNNKFEKYRIPKGNYSKLLKTMVLPPTSIILAQASLESGWGKSRVAKDANNLFGMRSFNKNEPRIKALQSETVFYRKYNSLRESTEDYILNLSRHKAYEEFRELIVSQEKIELMIEKLSEYSELPEYSEKLSRIISVNKFEKYDS